MNAIGLCNLGRQLSPLSGRSRSPQRLRTMAASLSAGQGVSQSTMGLRAGGHPEGCSCATGLIGARDLAPG